MSRGIFITLTVAGLGLVCLHMLRKAIDQATDDITDWSDPHVPPALLSLGADCGPCGGGMLRTAYASPAFYLRYPLVPLCSCGCGEVLEVGAAFHTNGDAR